MKEGIIVISSARVNTISETQEKIDGLDLKMYLFNVALVFFFGTILLALYQLGF